MHIEQADVVSQVIMAPARPELGPNKTIFLAGNTTPTGGPDWRETLCERLAENPITIFNPKRDDWDSTWREDFSDPRWAEQVNWELDMQDRADIVVFVFHGVSVAPISLLELGLAARSGKAVVCLLEGYSKAGNVEAICQRYGLLLIRHEIFLRACIIAKLVSDE